MKKKSLMKLVSLMCLPLLITFVLFIAAWAQPARAQHPVTNINVMASKMGGDAYIFGFALAEIVNKHSKWLRLSTIETRGSAQNTKTLVLKPETRKNTVIFSQEGAVHQAKEGHPPLKGHAYGGLRAIATYLYTGQCFLTLNPNIKSPKDFVGKKISFYAKGSASTTYITDIIKYGYGVDPSRMRYSYGPPKAGLDALADGLVDARIMNITPVIWKVPPAAQTIISAKDAYIVGFTKEAVKAGREKGGYPMSAIRVPAGSVYPAQPELHIVDSSHIWYVDVSMPSDIVYEITKQIYENIGEFAKYTAAGKTMTKEGVALHHSSETLLHPGAAKFYKEVGVLR